MESSEWYSRFIPGVPLLTFDVLRQVLHFAPSQLALHLLPLALLGLVAMGHLCVFSLY